MNVNREPRVGPESTTRSVTEIVNGSHTFNISGYSLLKGMGPRSYVCSATFNVGGYDWAINFYPDGEVDEDYSEYVSVFIVLASEGTDVRAMFDLSLMDQSGKGNHKVYIHFGGLFGSRPNSYTLKNQGSMWGYSRFFRKTSLESSDYLKNDCLSIKATVGVIRSISNLLGISVPPSDMGQSLKTMLDNELGCDIVFQVGKETFKAHKLVLGARSPVYKAQFFGNPNLDKVELQDVEPSIFKVVLHFIYSDELPDIHEMADSTSTSSAIIVRRLLEAADRFGLDRLKIFCESKLSEKISADTVEATLSLAVKHGCPQLESMCLKYAANHMGVVMRTAGFRHMETSWPSLLSELLETVALADEKPNLISGKKRSDSSRWPEEIPHCKVSFLGQVINMISWCNLSSCGCPFLWDSHLISINK